MGYYSELHIRIANGECGYDGEDRDGATDLEECARLLGGEVDGPNRVCCPSPGRPAHDRTMVVRIYSRSSIYIYDCVGPMGKAYAFVRERLHIETPPSASNQITALNILEETCKAERSLVERYLNRRALTLPIPKCLRFHPRLWHSPNKSLCPGMVAERADAEGRVVAIHRTFLAYGGLKAPVEPQRMDLGPAKGTAIRLSPLADELMIGEGIETTLSVMQVTGKPGWAAGSAVMMRHLVLPRSVRSVMILVDGDKAGEDAALAAGARWKGEGREVRLSRAPPGKDFNDLLKEGARK